jgi:hypothetical protein
VNVAPAAEKLDIGAGVVRRVFVEVVTVIREAYVAALAEAHLRIEALGSLTLRRLRNGARIISHWKG